MGSGTESEKNSFGSRTLIQIRNKHPGFTSLPPVVLLIFHIPGPSMFVHVGQCRVQYFYFDLLLLIGCLALVFFLYTKNDTVLLLQFGAKITKYSRD
jgi:hypothetical protein